MASKVGFFCHWEIKNYSYCVNEMLLSPSFTVIMLNDTLWNLCMQKKKVNGDDVIVCNLKRNNDKGPCNIELCYEISIIGPNQKLVQKCLQVEEDFETNTFGKEIILMSYKFYKENSMDAFEKERLIVCCRMWKSEITDTKKYFIRTPVKTHNRYLKWDFKDISSLKHVEYLLKCSERDSSPYKFQLHFGEVGGPEAIFIYIFQMEPSRSQHVKCKLSLMDSEGKILVSKQGERDFFSTEMFWVFPRNMDSRWLIKYKDLRLPNNTLCLLAELKISGAGVDGLEQINFGEGFDELLVPLQESIHSLTRPKSVTAISLTNKLLNFYKEGKLCDVVLKTDSSSFPVHKVILCAQSPVFSAMLGTDLEEKQTGTIPIPNMSDDTVQKLITFMYTDQVEDLNFEGAMSLYFASDQYDIVQLKQLCRNFLKSKLDTSNITDALVVADLHQDEDLKEASHDFIFEHDSEVIVSDKWNQFMQDYLKLAAETTHLLYRRKLKK